MAPRRRQRTRKRKSKGAKVISGDVADNGMPSSSPVTEQALKKAFKEVTKITVGTCTTTMSRKEFEEGLAKAKAETAAEIRRRVVLQEKLLQGMAENGKIRQLSDEKKVEYVRNLRLMMDTLGMTESDVEDILLSYEKDVCQLPAPLSETSSRSPSPSERIPVEGELSGEGAESVEDEEEEEPFKPRLPCYGCRKSRCANCLVRFKKGQKRWCKVPSKHHAISDADYVTIEVALVCIFDPESPYMKWVRDKEIEALMEIVDLNKINLDPAMFPDPEERKLVTEMQKTSKGTAVSENKVERESQTVPVEDVDSSEQVEDHKEVKEKQDGSVNSDGELSTKMVAEVVWSSNKKLPEFYLCEGCEKLLTIMFAVWELLEMKKITETMYFRAVMAGFNISPEAQNVVYNPPKGSKNYVITQYSSKCHPIGCQKRTTGRGIRIDLKTDEDFIKHGVGILHAFFQEAFCRVFNEILKEMFCTTEEENNQHMWG